MESSKVSVNIGNTVKCPFDTVTLGVGKRSCITDMTTMTTITVDCTILASHFPVIVLRAVTLSDNPTETTFSHWIELLVCLSCQRVSPTIESVTELLSHEKIALTF